MPRSLLKQSCPFLCKTADGKRCILVPPEDKTWRRYYEMKYCTSGWHLTCPIYRKKYRDIVEST